MLGSSCMFLITKGGATMESNTKLEAHHAYGILSPLFLYVEEYGIQVSFSDNLKCKEVDSTGKYFTSRGIVHLGEGNFLGIKVESHEGTIETEIISDEEAIRLIN